MYHTLYTSEQEEKTPGALGTWWRGIKGAVKWGVPGALLGTASLLAMGRRGFPVQANLRRVKKAAAALYPTTKGVQIRPLATGKVAEMGKDLADLGKMTNKKSSRKDSGILGPLTQGYLNRLGRAIQGQSYHIPKGYAPKKGSGEARELGVSEPGIYLGKRAGHEILAHELGHAAGKLSPRISLPLYGLSGKTSLVLTGNVVGHPIIERTSWDRETKRRAHVALGAAPIAMLVPRLGSEGLATIRGARIVRKAGLPMGRYLKKMGPAFGTYLGQSAAPVGAAIGMTVPFVRRRKKE